MVFIQQPSDATTGSAISPAVTVQLQDALGNNVTAADVSIAMSLSSGTGVLSGTTPKATNASGLATFSDLSINLAGSKSLTATSGVLTPAVSNSFTISAPVASGGGGGGGTTYVSITSTNPSSGATGVGTNTAVTATFSTYMDGSTLTPDTFKLSSGGE